jgi:hypothetical protein
MTESPSLSQHDRQSQTCCSNLFSASEIADFCGNHSSTVIPRQQKKHHSLGNWTSAFQIKQLKSTIRSKIPRWISIKTKWINVKTVSKNTFTYCSMFVCLKT